MAATKESLRFKTADRLELTLGVSEEWAETLARVKDVASQKMKRAVSTEEALLLAMSKYLDANDPLEKAKRAKAKESNQATESAQKDDISHKQRSETHLRQEMATSHKPPVSARSENADMPKNSPFSRTVKAKRRPLPANLKHDLIMRDQGRCTEHDQQGNRCENRRWLDVHHVVPIAHGGLDELANLRTLCSEHHKLEHAHSRT